MVCQSLRTALQFAVGVVIAAAVLQTWLVLGWIVPITVSGSSMAPGLPGPHRLFHCSKCGLEFAVGADQLPLGPTAICPHCGQHHATATPSTDQPGERLAVDRTAFSWCTPQRWETVVFRCPENAGELCVKRVVGLPGETISLVDGDVWINGQIVRKSLAQQRALRQLVDPASVAVGIRDTQVGDVVCQTSSRWQRQGRNVLEYRQLRDGPITDEASFNQGSTPPINRVPDIMMTFDAQFARHGRLVMRMNNALGRGELTADLGRQSIALRQDGLTVGERPLPDSVAKSGRFSQWTISLFDRQVLVAIGDEIVLTAPWENHQPPKAATDALFTMGVYGLSGEIRRLSVWRDVYYAVRYGDGRQLGTQRGPVVSWRLGPTQYFVIGDNAAISDDSRSWPSAAGLDAKLLIGRPLGGR